MYCSFNRALGAFFGNKTVRKRFFCHVPGTDRAAVKMTVAAAAVVVGGGGAGGCVIISTI